MKEKSPAFQFYPKDFLTDERVIRMTAQEIGIYVLLICHAWIENGISDIPEDLARACRVPKATFSKAWKKIRPLFSITTTDGRLHNQRQEEERQKQLDYRQAKSEAGKRGMEKRYHSNNTVITDHLTKSNFAVCSLLSATTTTPQPPTENFTPDWSWFESNYPGQIIPDRDCQFFLSKILDAKSEQTMRENLEAWKESRQWKRGKIYSATTFLRDGVWKTKPIDAAPQDDGGISAAEFDRRNLERWQRESGGAA